MNRSLHINKSSISLNLSLKSHLHVYMFIRWADTKIYASYCLNWKLPTFKINSNAINPLHITVNHRLSAMPIHVRHFYWLLAPIWPPHEPKSGINYQRPGHGHICWHQSFSVASVSTNNTYWACSCTKKKLDNYCYTYNSTEKFRKLFWHGMTLDQKQFYAIVAVKCSNGWILEFRGRR